MGNQEYASPDFSALRAQVKTVVIALPDKALAGRVRTRKLTEHLKGEHVPVVHWAWDRDNDSPAAPERVVLVRGGGYSGARTHALYFWWMIRLFFKSWTIHRRSLIWAVGVESALPLVPAMYFRKIRVVFDDADRTSLTLPLPMPAKRVLQFLERLTSRASSVHLIPNRRRYEFSSANFVEVKNFPSSIDIARAMAADLNGYQALGRKTIYVNGYLEDSRGLDTVLRLVDRINSAGLSNSYRFLLAGNVRGDCARRLIGMPSVEYVGRLDLVQSLALYRVSDFVLTYYDPRVEINKFAEANKWGDALKMGTAILVNSEVVTADWLLEARVAMAVEYSDDAKLFALLNSISLDEMRAMKERALTVGEKFANFESSLGLVLGKAVGAL